MFGYAEQIRSMMRATTAEAVRRVHPSSATVPALRARDKRVEEYAHQQFGRVVAARRPRAATVNGWEAGKRAATAADLGRSRLGPLRALGSGR
jgi:hypothetical protein